MLFPWSSRFADWPFRRKMLLLPAVAAAALGITLLVNVRFDLMSTDLSARIENGYYPSQELSRDLEETLEAIQRGLQDAVATRDDGELALPDSLRDLFLRQIRRARVNPVASVPELVRLEAAFDDYYALARATSQRMIRGEAGEGINGAIATMSKQYVTIKQALDTRHARDRHAVSAASYSMRHLQLLGAIVGVAINLAWVVVVTALSLIVIKSLTGPVSSAVAVANRLAKGDLQVEIPVTSRDEIGQLLLAMREMVSYLREMAGVAELISGGDISAEVNPRSVEDSFGCALRDMSGYLKEMAAVADRISAGDLTIDLVPRSAADRFGHAFLAMVAHLATSIEELQASENTNRRLAEYLSAAQERLEHLLRSSPAVIYSRDLDEGHPFTFVGQNLMALLGCDSAALQEDPTRWASRVHVEDARQAASALNMAAELGHFSCEYRVRHETGGYRWIHDEMRRVIREGAGIEIVGWWLDVTERREAENALHQSESQLRLSQKMEAVGRLAGGIAHDFNNVLTAILGYSDMTLEALEADNPLTQDVLEIKKAAQRAANLTRQLLAFSRQQVLQFAVVDLNTVAAEMCAMLRRLIGEDIKLVVLPGAQGSFVRADVGQVQQVIMNLAVNARDAMPNGGSLTLATSSVTLDAATTAAWESDAKPGAYVQLVVSDTGHGMTVETQKRIFEPFFTTKEVGKGTGLGLATVYGIVRQSGGHIRVDSAVGQGTTFRICLPQVQVNEDVTDQATPVASTPSDGTETILLVEDEESVRVLARRILQRRGYRVFDARQAEEALGELARIPDTIDLLLTDVVMPGIRGPELARQVTAQRPNIGVLYMSGYTDRDLIDQDPTDVDDRLLQKPFTPEGLAMAVRAAIDENQARIRVAN